MISARDSSASARFVAPKKKTRSSPVPQCGARICDGLQPSDGLHLHLQDKYRADEPMWTFPSLLLTLFRHLLVRRCMLSDVRLAAYPAAQVPKPSIQDKSALVVDRWCCRDWVRAPPSHSLEKDRERGTQIRCILVENYEKQMEM